jgi:anti-sigma factor RsiW
MTCEEVEPLLAQWADEELPVREREIVDAHLRQCSPCRTQAGAGRDVRVLLQTRREALRHGAPPDLHARLANLARSSRRTSRGWSRTWLVAAATLALVFFGSALHVATPRSETVLAAQLAVDHVKCHLLQRDHGLLDPAAVSERLAVRYGFAVSVPAADARDHLRLIGARRCLTGEGANAHILYQAAGRPVSLYLLPAGRHPRAVVDVLGQHAIVWSRHNGTYVLIAGEDTPDLDRIAAYMQAATE